MRGRRGRGSKMNRKRKLGGKSKEGFEVKKDGGEIMNV